MNFLYAAYTATWIIHITYLGILVRRYQRLSGEIEELKKKSVRPCQQVLLSYVVCVSGRAQLPRRGGCPHRPGGAKLRSAGVENSYDA